MTFLRRLLYLLRNRRMEAEFAEELETHRLLAQQRELQAGAADAAAASRRAMGNVTLAREDARAQWIAPWLDSVWQDGMYALRGFRRAPAFTVAFVLVMALGVGATTAVFALVDSLVLRDLPVNRPDRRVYFSSPSFSYPIFTGVQARSTDVLTSVAAWSIEDEYVAWSQQLEPSEVLTASGGFYDTLGVTAAVGRTFSDADDRIGGGSEGRVAVISYSAWQRRYGGNPGVVGRTVRVGPDTYTIVGVTPRAFFGVAPGVAPEITIPLTSNARPSSLQSATSSWVHLIGRLRDGVSLAEANTALQRFWPAVLEGSVGTKVPADRRESFLGRQTSIESARAGFSRVRNRFARPLWFLFALVALLLVVAAASAANLLLARGAGRRREIAVRLAIGAGRGRLVRQMLTESMVLTTIAAAAGLLIAKWGAGSLLALMTTREQVITLDAGISNRIVLFSLALAAITSALCSVIPAFRATRVDPACGLKAATGTLRTFGSGPASGRTIVAAQVAVSVLLLASATLFARSLYGVLSRTAGVDRQVLVVTADAEAGGYEDERAAGYYQQFLERVRNVPGVAAASISMYPPLSGGDGAWTQNAGIDGAAPGTDTASVVYFNTISSGYFRTTGMTLLRGRDIADSDIADSDASRGRERGARGALLPRTGPDRPADHDRPRQQPADPANRRRGLGCEIPAAPGGAAQRGVSAMASAAGREHVPRAARRLAGSSGRGRPPRSTQHRRGGAGAPADGRRADPRVARHRARAGDAGRAPRRRGGRFWRAQDSTACWRTPSPGRRARSACAWRSARTRAP